MGVWAGTGTVTLDTITGSDSSPYLYDQYGRVRIFHGKEIEHISMAPLCIHLCVTRGTTDFPYYSCYTVESRTPSINLFVPLVDAAHVSTFSFYFAKGINGVNKGFPWYPNWFLDNKTLVDSIASWGMNVIRVGWMWTGFEPEQDAFNMTYLEMQLEVVDRLAAAGRAA